LLDPNPIWDPKLDNISGGARNFIEPRQKIIANSCDIIYIRFVLTDAPGHWLRYLKKEKLNLK